MPRYNDISLLYTPIASSGGGGVSSISLNNGITSIAGDTAFINAKGSGTLDVVASVVRGSNTILGTLDVSGTSIFKSPATFKAITGDSIYTTGSASFGPLTAGLSRLGTVISGGLTSTSISSTGGVSAGSLVIGGTSSLQGGLTTTTITATGASNLAGVNATSLSTGTITATGDANLSTVIAGTVTVTGLKAIYTLTATGPSTFTTVSAGAITSTGLSTNTLTSSGQTNLAYLTVSQSIDNYGIAKFRNFCEMDNHLTVAMIMSAGTVNSKGNLDVSGSAIVKGGISVGGFSNFTNGLQAGGSCSVNSLNVNGGLFVNSSSVFQNVDINGNFTVSKIFEKTNIVDATSLLLDMNLGSSFILPLSFLPTANYSISIVNVPLDTNKTFTITLITRQATTSFYASTLKVSNVSNQFILGSSSTVGSAIFNGGPPTFSTSPCLITQCFNIISIPDNSSLGTYSRFVVSSVNCHY